MVETAEMAVQVVQAEMAEIVDKNSVKAVLTTNTNILMVVVIEVVFENH